MEALYLPKYGLNISRSHLPQIKSTDMEDFLHWLLIHKGISYKKTHLGVSDLHPTQGDFNTTKIRHFMTDKIENLKKPIVVSSDHYVIDGHHRWIALLNLDPTEDIPVCLIQAKDRKSVV